MPKRTRSGSGSGSGSEPHPFTQFEVGDDVVMSPDAWEVFQGLDFPMEGVVTDVGLPRRGQPGLIAVHGMYWHPENWRKAERAPGPV
jgi:hypothetical protein